MTYVSVTSCSRYFWTTSIALTGKT